MLLIWLLIKINTLVFCRCSQKWKMMTNKSGKTFHSTCYTLCCWFYFFGCRSMWSWWERPQSFSELRDVCRDRTKQSSAPVSRWYISLMSSHSVSQWFVASYERETKIWLTERRRDLTMSPLDTTALQTFCVWNGWKSLPDSFFHPHWEPASWWWRRI